MAGLNVDVSVVIPTRNRRTLLSRAVASVLAQRGVQAEVIIVDDGSTDGTADMVRGWGVPAVKLMRCPDAVGVSHARNIGIACANAPWVAFLDDDDIWAPSKLEVQLRALNAAPASRWSCTGAVWIDAADRLVGWSAAPGSRVTKQDVLVHNAVPGGGSSVVVEAKLLRACGGFAPDLALFEDWELWIRLAERAPAVAVARPLVGFRIGNSTTTRNASGLRAAWNVVAARHGNAALAAGVEADLAALLRFEAFRYLHGGEYRAAARRYRELGKARAALAVRVVGPGWRWAQGYRNARSIPVSWRSEAERWVPTAARASVPAGPAERARLVLSA